VAQQLSIWAMVGFRLYTDFGNIRDLPYWFLLLLWRTHSHSRRADEIPGKPADVLLPRWKLYYYIMLFLSCEVGFESYGANIFPFQIFLQSVPRFGGHSVCIEGPLGSPPTVTAGSKGRIQKVMEVRPETNSSLRSLLLFTDSVFTFSFLKWYKLWKA